MLSTTRRRTFGPRINDLVSLVEIPAGRRRRRGDMIHDEGLGEGLNMLLVVSLYFIQREATLEQHSSYRQAIASNVSSFDRGLVQRARLAPAGRRLLSSVDTCGRS